jgi:hypothetical protein
MGWPRKTWGCALKNTAGDHETKLSRSILANKIETVLTIETALPDALL